MSKMSNNDQGKTIGDEFKMIHFRFTVKGICSLTASNQIKSEMDNAGKYLIVH